jgi:hypothetical protein
LSAGPAGAPPRRHAASTRGFHLRRILRGRAAGYALALGVVGAFVAGAWMGSPVVMLAGPVAVAVLVLAIVFRSAAGRAERDFFVSFARARGLRYVGDTALPPLTPLLGAGDRREWSHWMEGPVGDLRCGLGYYTWYEARGHEERVDWTPHHCTICVVDLEPGIRLFPGVFLARRRGLAGLLGGGWLGTRTRRKVELESAQLHERYELWVQRSQDDVLLRELFSPSFVVWLAEHPLEPCFEYRAGTLVVYLERRLADAGRLGWLLDATEEIAVRFAREVAEATAGAAA